MLHINEIELYREPRDKIEEIFVELPGEPEMSEEESAFLCGLIKKYEPQKIVEVGVAGGGTSAIILSCIKSLGLDKTKLISVDYSEKFYRNNDYFSGHLGTEAARELGLEKNYRVLLGDIACSFAEVNTDIDFLIIDTMHVTPGEILDYIALLPYLQDDAVVVFHDIALPYLYKDHRSASVMSILFAIASGEKYVNTFDFDGVYANIGALRVTPETMEKIENVFLSLLVPWEYLPDSIQLKGYRSALAQNYNNHLLDIFDKAVEINYAYPKVTKRTEWLFPFDVVELKSKVVIFCAGAVGREFIRQVNHANYCDIVAVVDNDETKQSGHVFSPKTLSDSLFDYVIVATVNEKIAKRIISQIENMGIANSKIIWRDYRVNE